MTPTAALWILLGILLVSTALVAPMTWELRQEIKRAKKTAINPATGVVLLILRFSALALWWYYALEVDQILLAIIPTAGGLFGAAMNALVKLTKEGSNV